MKNNIFALKHLILKIIFAVPVILLFAGCFEVRNEIEIHQDGSGTIKGTLLISERMVVGIESAKASDGNISMSPKTIIDEVSLRAQFGEDIEVVSMQVEDQPDGSRRIQYEIKTEDILTFLNSPSGNQLFDVRVVRINETTGGLEFKNGVDSTGIEPELDQLYGLMKGLYVETNVILPVDVSGEFPEGHVEDRTVTWTFDLRNREGLERAKQIDEKFDGKNPVARFDFWDGAFDVDSLPLASSEIKGGVVRSEMENAGGVRAEVAAITGTRQHKLVSDERLGQLRISNLAPEELELHVMLTWDEDSRPTNYSTVVLEEMVTDTGENLLEEETRHSFNRGVNDHQDAVLASVKVKMPSSPAKSIAFVKGYVPIVAGIEVKTFLIDNPGSQVGPGKLEDDSLELLGVVLKDVNGSVVSLEMEGRILESIFLVKADGRRLRVTQSGCSGSNNTYTCNYTFSEAVEAEDHLEVSFRVSEENAKVPFEARDIPLP